MASEVLQQLDLAQGALGQNLLAEDIGNLFDGNTFIGLVVDGGTIDGGLISIRPRWLRCALLCCSWRGRVVAGWMDRPALVSKASIRTRRYHRLPGPTPW